MASKYQFVIVGKDGTLAAFESVQNNAASLEKTVKRVGGAVASAFGAQKIIEFADSWTLLQNRLKTVSDSEQELNNVTRELLALAADTRSELSSTVELFARFTRNSENLNLSQKQLLIITELVNKAFQIQGATSAEAAGATVQFSQALASGVLRGQEFNSVSEQGTEILKAIGRELGKDIGQLRAMAKEGELTADVVVNALLNQADSVRETYDKTASTVGQAWSQVSDSILAAMGKVDERLEASRGLAEVLSLVATNIRILSGSATELEQAEESVRKLEEKIKAFEKVNISLINFGEEEEGIFSDRIDGYKASLIEAQALLKELQDQQKKLDEDARNAGVNINKKDDEKSADDIKLERLQKRLEEETKLISDEMDLRRAVLLGSITEEEARVLSSHNKRFESIKDIYEQQRELAKGNADQLAQIDQQYNDASKALRENVAAELEAIETESTNRTLEQRRKVTEDLVSSLEKQILAYQDGEQAAFEYDVAQRLQLDSADKIPDAIQAQIDKLYELREAQKNAYSNEALLESTKNQLEAIHQENLRYKELDEQLEIERYENQKKDLERQREELQKHGLLTQEMKEAFTVAERQAYENHIAELAALDADRNQQIAEGYSALLDAMGAYFAGMEGERAAYVRAAISLGQTLLDAEKREALVSIGQNTYDAAMKAYKALAGIPYIGPALGAAAAGTVIAAGGAYAAKVSGLASFDGGGYTGSGSRSGGVDNKGGFPAILHPHEYVIDLTKLQSGGKPQVPSLPNFTPSQPSNSANLNSYSGGGASPDTQMSRGPISIDARIIIEGNADSDTVDLINMNNRQQLRELKSILNSPI